MWVAQPKQELTPDEYFVQRVQLIAAKYNVEVEIDWKRRTVDFQTEDEALQNAIAFELDEYFGV